MFVLNSTKQASWTFALFFISSLHLSHANFGQILPPIWLLLENQQESRFEQVLSAYTDSTSSHVFIAAHRGGKENDEADRAPGNSIANIANASTKNFDLYESDIEILLGNGQETLVVFHDDVFDFLTNTNQVDDKLDDADLNYAKSLRLTYDNGAVSNETIPSLEEFLLAAKDQIMVKFDLKSGVFSESRLLAIFNIIQETGTQNQVLIRGGDFLLTTARDNGFNTNIIMRRYNTAPSIADINTLTDSFNVKAISIPDGASADVIQAAISKGLIVEVHGSQGVSDQQREMAWQAALDAGVRQFHSFKPTLLRNYLEQHGYREF